MTISAGQLIHRIEIQRSTMIVAAAGNPVVTWSTWTTRHAEIVEQKRANVQHDSGELEEATVTFRLRWLRGLELEDQILFDGEAYRIVSIAEPERRVEHLVECRRIG